MGRPRTDIPKRIVHAARARFLAEGVDGASLRDIARDARTNIGMVFYYFPTKDDLFLGVVEEVYGKLTADLGELLQNASSTREKLMRAFARVGTASDEELQIVRLVIGEALLSSERFHRVLARSQSGHLKLFAETLANGVASGEVDATIPLPLLLISTLALGGFPQLLRRAKAQQFPFSELPEPEAMARASVELLFRAIRPHPSGRAFDAHLPSSSPAAAVAPVATGPADTGRLPQPSPAKSVKTSRSRGRAAPRVKRES